jgi:hypothetical protein
MRCSGGFKAYDTVEEKLVISPVAHLIYITALQVRDLNSADCCTHSIENWGVVELDFSFFIFCRRRT